MRVTVQRQQRPPRTAFTLIEILAVIVVISILIALLVPAVMGAMKKVRITGVRAEISQFETAIGKFKAVYGMEPPSSIVLQETAANWSGDPTSRAIIRQLWPQYDFTSNIDINGNGNTTDSITLAGPECLVFFLGGPNVVNTPGSAPLTIGACLGFSKNPAFPFDRTSKTREAPLFEFQPNRFKDMDGDGFPEYLDSLPSQTAPYLYYSSYDGGGYNSLNNTEFSVINSTFGGLVEPYRQGVATTAPYWKPNGFQIISPGYDHQYGFGGAYVTTGTDRTPGSPTVSAQYPNGFSSTAPTPSQRIVEADNITNFSEGTLVP
ncbi:MAG: type II secretion system protein [Planctomycetes bacterium]|nr:type II secretion system protein [Planctomycetota bacterium]